MINDQGIKMNSDGSTNNLAEYTWYSRDTLMKKLMKNYVSFIIWAYLSGTFIFLVSVYSMGGIIN